MKNFDGLIWKINYRFRQRKSFWKNIEISVNCFFQFK